MAFEPGIVVNYLLIAVSKTIVSGDYGLAFFLL